MAKCNQMTPVPAKGLKYTFLACKQISQETNRHCKAADNWCLLLMPGMSISNWSSLMYLFAAMTMKKLQISNEVQQAAHGL